MPTCAGIQRGIVTHGSAIHCTLSQETLGYLAPFIRNIPQVPVIGSLLGCCAVRSMKEPGTDPFSLGHCNGRDKITVARNKRNMGHMLLPAVQCDIKSQEQVHPFLH